MNQKEYLTMKNTIGLSETISMMMSSLGLISTAVKLLVKVLGKNGGCFVYMKANHYLCSKNSKMV